MVNFESMNAEQIHESINLKFHDNIPDWEMNRGMSGIEIGFIKNIVLSEIESLNKNLINVDHEIKKTNSLTHRINFLFMIASSFSKNPMIVKLLSDYFNINVSETYMMCGKGQKYKIMMIV